jgi:hypothetical protein
MFPFKDVDVDIQEYGEHVYYHMNSLILQIKEWLDKSQVKSHELSTKLQQGFIESNDSLELEIEEKSPNVNSQENTESKMRVNCRSE